MGQAVTHVTLSKQPKLRTRTEAITGAASTLVKVNRQGAAVDTVARPVNATGLTIHAAVHAARPDVECVIHLHSPWAAAIDGCVPPVSDTWAQRTFAHRADDGGGRDGDAEWPALLRRAERLTPGYRS